MNLNDFRSNTPTPEQMVLLEQATNGYEALATRILEEVSNSAHRTAALRLLLESKMMLIHGITHPQI